MLKKFFPYEYVESVFNIDYEKLYNLGYRGVVFDIDNTLVLHGTDSTPQIDELFKFIHSIGLKTLLLSNNDTARIERFIKNIDTQYIPDANKPNPDNYHKAIEMLSLRKEEVVFVGDQIFTDIYGANKCNAASILVDFLRHENETNFGKRRLVEKYILKFYKMSKSYMCRIGDIRTERKSFDYGKEAEETLL